MLVLGCGSAGAPDAALPDAPMVDAYDGDPDGLVLLFLIDASETVRGHQEAALDALVSLREPLREDVGIPVVLGVLDTFMRSPGPGSVGEACAAGTGGRLRRDGEPAVPGCRATYPPWHVFDPDRPEAALHDAACVVRRLESCPIEQPLESLAMALGAPSRRFGVAGEPGTDVLGGLRFERPFVAVFAFVPEDDCSTRRTSVQTRDDTTLAPDERCARFAGDLGSVQRHVEAILEAVPPRRLALYFFGGIPPEAIGRSVDDLAADPNIAPRFRPDGLKLEPACRAPSGIAVYPPDRQLDFLAAMQARGVFAAEMGSLCRDYREELERVTATLFFTRR